MPTISAYPAPSSELDGTELLAGDIASKTSAIPVSMVTAHADRVLKPLNVDGSRAMLAALLMGGYGIKNLGDPVNDDDAVSKKYIADNGSEIVLYSAPGSDFIQTQYNKNQQTYSFADAGCVGDGIADDTTAAQQAIDYCVLHGYELRHTGGIIRTTAPLSITNGLTVRGCGTVPYHVAVDSTFATGSWFLFDHPGVGIDAGNGVLTSGIRLFDFGTVRNQPAPDAVQPSFTATTTANSATLNVTAVTAGVLQVGSIVVGPGIPFGTTIAALGSGAGGAGTYTMSQAATISAAGVAVIATNFVPGNFDYDIKINNAHVIINELMLLNPTKGIDLINGNAGRLTIGTIYGQPLLVGINVEQSLDIFTAQLCDWWPYWQNNLSVHYYTATMRDTLWLQRVDGPMITAIFDIFSRSVIRCSQNANGKTTKLMLGAIYGDGGCRTFWIDNTATAVIAQISLMASQCLGGLTDAQPVVVEGPNCQVDILSFRCDAASKSAISVTGAASYVSIALPTVNNWNADATAAPAFSATGAGSTIRLAVKPITSGGGGAPVYSATGTIEAPDRWATYTPAITVSSGAFTTMGALNFTYKVSGNVVDIDFSMTITTNGSAAGIPSFALPFPATAPACGTSIESAQGRLVSVNILSGAGTAQLRLSDGSYPGASGTTISGSVRYRI